MQVAIPIWKDRVSPVFDTTRSVLIVYVEDGVEVRRSETRFFPELPIQRIRRLIENGVNVLVCGAISQRFLNMCEGVGIRVIPWICGPVDRVLEAFLKGELPSKEFLMPGCCGRRRRVRARGEGQGGGGRRRGGGRGGRGGGCG